MQLRGTPFRAIQFRAILLRAIPFRAIPSRPAIVAAVVVAMALTVTACSSPPIEPGPPIGTTTAASAPATSSSSDTTSNSPSQSASNTESISGGLGSVIGQSPTSASTHERTAPITGVTVAGTIATGLTTPWGLGFLPDGTALVTERDTGKLLSISADASRSVGTVGSVAGVVPAGEGGLLGLAVSPGFATDRTVYVYYTASSDNRVAALTLNDSTTEIVNQHDIVTGIPKATIHNGGRLLMAADGTIFAGTGDAGQSEQAQLLTYLGGKILHFTGDGDPVAGNPFADAPLVYSYGHRNVQGLAFDTNGRLWASEFGANTYDELNLIQPGGNYGWPIFEGPSDDPKYVAPYKYWPTSEASPSGLAIIGQTAFMAALRGSRLWLIPLDGPAGETKPIAQLHGDYGRLRTVAVAPDGSLWLTTSNTDGRGTIHPGDDRILRLTVH